MAKNMSLESALDDERKDILALLENKPSGRERKSASSAGSGRASSPFTPQAPVRSMLDIGESAAPRSSPLPSANGESPGSPRVPAASTTASASTSPMQSNNRAYLTNSQRQQHRSLSDAATRPADFGPRSNVLELGQTGSQASYQISGYVPSHPGVTTPPKRNTQGSRKVSIPSAMAEVVRGGDLSLFNSLDRGRHRSIAGTGISTAKSGSPHNRLALRSTSPHLSAEPPQFVTKDGRTIDMKSAYRRLSDANLAMSGGNLALLSKKGRRRTNSGASSLDAISCRLEKDYNPLDEEDALVDSSDEDHSSVEESTRGRRKTAEGRSEAPGDHHESKAVGMSRVQGPGTAQSLIAAAEEERMYTPGIC